MPNSFPNAFTNSNQNSRNNGGGRGAIIPWERFAMLGDSNAQLGDTNTPSNGNRVFHDRGIAQSIGIQLGWRLSLAQRVSGTDDKPFYYGGSGATIQTIRATHLPALISDHAAHLDTTLCVIYAGGNNLANGDSSATVLGYMDLLLQDVIASGMTPLVYTIRPRSYAESGPDERVILPIRQAYCAALIAYCAANDIMCVDVQNDGEDPGNLGYGLAGATSAYELEVAVTGRPGHLKGHLAGVFAQKAVELISSHPRFPSPDAHWLTGEAKTYALQNPSRPGGGNANGNPYLTGTGTEGSPVVCAGCRIAVLSGTATWTWETVTHLGETWKKLNILTNSGEVALRSQNTGTAGFWSLIANYSASEYIYMAAELEGVASGWNFSKVALQFNGATTPFPTTIGNGETSPTPTLVPFPQGSVITTMPMKQANVETTGCSGGLYLKGTGSLLLKFIGTFRQSEVPGPFTYSN